MTVVVQVARRVLTAVSECFVNFTCSDECATPPEFAVALCRVLLVVDDPQRQALLRACVKKNLPGCRLEAVDSYFDAMARATRRQADLVVLDLSVDSLLVPALRRFLARSAPQTLVHVFDDSQDSTAVAESDCNLQSIVQLELALASLPNSPSHLPSNQLHPGAPCNPLP